jgi:hypothetical protein
LKCEAYVKTGNHENWIAKSDRADKVIPAGRAKSNDTADSDDRRQSNLFDSAANNDCGDCSDCAREADCDAPSLSLAGVPKTLARRDWFP